MTDNDFSREDAALIERYIKLRESVNNAEKAAGRPAGSVMILPAVKYATARQIDLLHREFGLENIGENRIQTMLQHVSELEKPDEMKIHVIGSLQKNKVKYAVGAVSLIQSVDSVELLSEIQRISEKKNVSTHVLIEINSGREESKTGVSPEDAEELASAVESFDRVILDGFMTMGPKCDNSDAYYKYFSETYKLSLDIWQKKIHNICRCNLSADTDSRNLPFLSMGMSDSFEPAIAAGASCVRVGRALFGTNPAIKNII